MSKLVRDRGWRCSQPSVQHFHFRSSATPLELETKVKRRLTKISKSRRRPLLGPSPGWIHLLVLSHLRHYSDTMLNGHWSYGKYTWNCDVDTIIIRVRDYANQSAHPLCPFCLMSTYQDPSGGLLCDCEIFPNLRLTFVSNSTVHS